MEQAQGDELEDMSCRSAVRHPPQIISALGTPSIEEVAALNSMSSHIRRAMAHCPSFGSNRALVGWAIRA